ncbi:aspartate aminotransferase family protein [Alloalcanivorax profundimaris]|uniref:aspartate aminotransferase family protein n=1 Tax=Alloalcanivorax profundimaris TaxID=2735259 RepID=UPI0018896B78|nr:aspartate aminotransferase family protein [Alloalcanivorax profundimaris]MBF1800956.1 aspartate aminotransferase family protein [Alloalcanivorax profundimaris]
MSEQFLIPTYARQPVAFERGEGVWLYDQAGERYLDAVSGIAVCNLGHAHPAVTRALADQAGRLVHTSNLYRIPVQEALAERLCRLSGMEKVFFSNSGAEANEAAVKLARLHGHRRGVDKPVVLVMENSFHGRTLATLSATGNAKVKEGFEPLVEGFRTLPYGDLAALDRALDEPDVVAVLAEPIQGEGGVRLPDDGFLAGLRERCDRHGLLLMLDEIQTGNGRTGSYFACQRQGVVPDVLTTAKGLGNGFPIGACLVAGAATELFGPGSHGSTFGGNPLGCATALAVVDALEAVIPEVDAKGERLRAALRDGLADLPMVTEVRGRGLIIGLQLDRPCAELVGRAREAGLLINVTAGSVVRLLPPLIIDDRELTFLADTLIRVIHDFARDLEGP